MSTWNVTEELCDYNYNNYCCLSVLTFLETTFRLTVGCQDGSPVPYSKYGFMVNNFFSENLAGYDMWKNNVEPGRPLMRCAC
jgi:hypothetical protein